MYSTHILRNKILWLLRVHSKSVNLSVPWSIDAKSHSSQDMYWHSSHCILRQSISFKFVKLQLLLIWGHKVSFYLGIDILWIFSRCLCKCPFSEDAYSHWGYENPFIFSWLRLIWAFKFDEVWKLTKILTITKTKLLPFFNLNDEINNIVSYK